jgi:hypothetical protein
VAHARARDVTALAADELRQLERHRRVPPRVHHEGCARLALGDDGRPQHLSLVLRPRVRGADLAEQPRPHAGVGHAGGHVGDHLAGQVVDRPPVHVGRMGRCDVVAGPHHDVQARGPGDARKGERVTRQAHGGRIDDGRPAGTLEEPDLVDGDPLVGEAQVVEVGVEVLAHPAEVGEAQRLGGAPLVAGRSRLGEHHGEVDEQVLVGERDPHRLRGDHPQHRLHLPGRRARHPPSPSRGVTRSSYPGLFVNADRPVDG